MRNLLSLYELILNDGEDRPDRTGVGTASIFGEQLKFDLRDGFPATTTKKLAFESCKAELLWFLEGSTDERRLAEITHGSRDISKSTIWTGNANAQGVALGYRNDAEVKELGPVYGKQWRDFGGVDQIRNVIQSIKEDPYGRRHIVSAWNVSELPKMALPPCHVMFQFYVSTSENLSCHMYQRSVDALLGLPFNVASYAMLTHMIAHVCNLGVGTLTISMGDVHIYKNHFSQVKEQLSRIPGDLPELWLNPDIKDIFDFGMNDIKLVGYNHQGAIKAPMAV